MGKLEDQARQLEEALAALRKGMTEDAAQAQTGQGVKSDATPPAPDAGDGATATGDGGTANGAGLSREELRRQVVGEIEAAFAAGQKSQEPVDVKALIKEVVAEFAEQQRAAAPEVGQDIKSLVQEALAEIKLPRKTPLLGSDLETEQGQGAKGGGTYIPSRKLGEKGNFSSFVLAVGRKDLSAVADMQRECGIRPGYGASLGYGTKALVSGGGAQDSVTGPSGGFLVPPEYATELIPLLYPYVAVRRAQPNVFTMRSPQFFQPRMAGGGSATYVGETAAIPSSQPTFDQFSLVAKELTALVPVSRFLVEDSDPAVVEIVKTDMARQIGLKEDITFLYGVGSSTVPQGIATASGTQQITAVGGNGDAISYDIIVEMENRLDRENIPNVRRAWFGHPDIRKALRLVKDDNLRPIFYDWENVQQGSLSGPNPTLMGDPFYMSTQVPEGTTGSGATTDLVYAEMSEVVVGQLGGIELMTSDEGTFVDGFGSTISAFQSNLTLFRSILRHDVSLYHSTAVVRRQGLLY